MALPPHSSMDRSVYNFGSQPFQRSTVPPPQHYSVQTNMPPSTMFQQQRPSAQQQPVAHSLFSYEQQFQRPAYNQGSYGDPEFDRRPQQNGVPQTNNEPESPETPSPDSDDNVEEERRLRDLPDIPPESRIHDGKIYVLEVVQQPGRARMCGFGDKDRRPITPPPCIRLRIYEADAHNRIGNEVDYKEMEDLSKYVIHVDMVGVDGVQGKNTLLHSQSSPSISTAQASGFPTTYSPMPMQGTNSQSYPVSNLPGYADTHYQQQPQAPQTPQAQRVVPNQWSLGSMGHDGRLVSPFGANMANGSLYPSAYTNGHTGYVQDQRSASMAPPRMSTGNGSISKNLLGSLSGNAQLLEDTNKSIGLWFVMQDMSVRTEGWFRLKFNIFDIRKATQDPTQLGPMLAQSFSKTFKVFSAKKFPGVVETTELSKKFSQQGVKIAIRKDNGKPGDKRKRRATNDEEYESEEEEA